VAGIHPADSARRAATLAAEPRLEGGRKLKSGTTYRSQIEPIAGEIARPVWSVMIPAFNANATLLETLTSVLAQDPGPAAMQIEVVDDCSTRDDTLDLVEQIGSGRIGFFRQPRNLGVAANLTQCIRRARGKLVHLLHADDLVDPGFYLTLEQVFDSQPRLGAAFCRHRFIDAQGRTLSLSPLERNESGVLENAIERLAEEQRIMTPAMVVRRSVYEEVGGFDTRLVCTEDWEMWVRIAARYPIWYETQPLASYRMHDDTNTGRHLRTGEDIRYTGLAIQLFTEHLPADTVRRAVPKARRTYAQAALRTAEMFIGRRDCQAAAAQLREALRLSRSPAVLARAASLAWRLALPIRSDRTQPTAPT
jgi:GT2 family glycosyltransferase